MLCLYSCFLFIVTSEFLLTEGSNLFKVISTTKIKDVFVTKSINAVDPISCFVDCPLVEGLRSQVFQINVFNQHGVMICRCSFTKSRYVRQFLSRYLQPSQSTNSTESVYVMQDNSNQYAPLLCYALDDVSNGLTLGTLTNQSVYQVNFSPAPPPFDCSRNDNQRKYLRSIPNTGQRHEILHK